MKAWISSENCICHAIDGNTNPTEKVFQQQIYKFLQQNEAALVTQFRICNINVAEQVVWKHGIGWKLYLWLDRWQHQYHQKSFPIKVEGSTTNMSFLQQNEGALVTQFCKCQEYV